MLKELKEISNVIPKDMSFDGNGIPIPEAIVITNDGKTMSISKLINWAGPAFKNCWGDRIDFDEIRSITTNSKSWLSYILEAIEEKKKCFITSS